MNQGRGQRLTALLISGFVVAITLTSSITYANPSTSNNSGVVNSANGVNIGNSVGNQDPNSAGGVQKKTNTTIVTAPDSAGKCHLVLVTIDTTGKDIKDCDNIPFTVYLNTFLDQLVPYVILIAMIMIVFSGFQYMTSGVVGDNKAARQRIIGILGGVIFYFLIRLIINQIAPSITIDTAQVPPSQAAPQTGK